MRSISIGAVAAVAAAAALAGCGGTVVERTDEAVVLRWDERRTGAGRVAEQALDLCSRFGYGARRAVAVADDGDGPVHTTRYACQPHRTGDASRGVGG